MMAGVFREIIITPSGCHPASNIRDLKADLPAITNPIGCQINRINQVIIPGIHYPDGGYQDFAFCIVQRIARKIGCKLCAEGDGIINQFKRMQVGICNVRFKIINRQLRVQIDASTGIQL